MKRTIKTIGVIGTMGVTIVCAYLLGTTQAETKTEVQTVTEIRDVIPDGYIDTNSNEFYDNYVDMRDVIGYSADDEGLQLYLDNGNGYYWER